MSNIATLTAKFRAEAAEFLSTLKTVNSESRKTGQTITKELNGAMRSLAGVISVGVFANFVRQQAQVADQSAKTADALDVQTERLQALRFAARSAGADVGLLDRALGESQKRLSAAIRGDGDAAKWIEKLGLKTQDLIRLAPDQLFQRYAEAISKLNTRGQQFEATQALMGKGSEKLINLINGGSAGLKQAAEDIKQLGIEMSRVDQRQIEQANDAMDRMKAVSEGIGQKIALALAPFVQEFANGVIGAAKETGNLNERIEGFVRLAVYGFGIAANAAKVFDAAISGTVFIVTTLGEKFLGTLRAITEASATVADKTGLTGFAEKMRSASESLAGIEGFMAAASETAAERVRNALAGIKSFEQMGGEIDRIVAAARARAEEAQRNARGLGGPEGDPQAEADRQASRDAALKALIEGFERERQFRKDLHNSLLSDEREFSERMIAEATLREQRRVESVQEAEATIAALRESATIYGIQLLQTLGQKNKAFALAALIFEKAIAIQKIIISSKIAAAAALEPPPIGLGPVYGAALAAKIIALGYVNAALVGALGVAQAANLMSDGGNALGSPTNPITTRGTSVDSQTGLASNTETRATTVYFYGFANEQNLRDMAELLREIDNRDIVIFSGQNAQARVIREGAGG